MSDTEPSRDQYPGYFPAAKRPFWSRAKVGTAAGIAGLLLGVGMGGGSAEPAPADPDSAKVQALVDQRVDDEVSEATDALEGQLADTRKRAQKAAEEAHRKLVATKKQAATAKAAAVKTAVTKAVAAERAKQAAATARSFAGTGGSTSGSTSDSSGSSGSGGGTDPIFGTCREANANGYGPYTRGVDPEYSSYQDRDDDGRVCER